MNTGTWHSKKCIKTDETFWPKLDKDTKKQILGTYEEHLRAQNNKARLKFSEDEDEGGEE